MNEIIKLLPAIIVIIGFIMTVALLRQQVKGISKHQEQYEIKQCAKYNKLERLITEEDDKLEKKLELLCNKRENDWTIIRETFLDIKVTLGEIKMCIETINSRLTKMESRLDKLEGK